MLDSPALEQSRALHERVRAFARVWDAPPVTGPPDDRAFEDLALDIARFQQEQSPGMDRLVKLRAGRLEHFQDIPAVPVDTFRLTRVATHPELLDAARFATSGTTQEERGLHPVRELATYDELALMLARRTLFLDLPRAIVVALASVPSRPGASSGLGTPGTPGPGTSSLGYMMQLFMRTFDGRALSRDPVGARFDVLDPDRWLVGNAGVDLEGLARVAHLARRRSEPLVILSTSFALAAALEALDGEPVRCPVDSRVMLTGGFKGRHTRLEPEELRAAATACFGIPSAQLLGEYGMTELTSQLYEGWVSAPPSHGSGRPKSLVPPPWWTSQGRPGVYRSPPWLRVEAVDPTTHALLPPGQPGLACFTDLANVDSAVRIATEDLVRSTPEGIELLGRQPRAPARGCSLPFEGLIHGGPP